MTKEHTSEHTPYSLISVDKASEDANDQTLDEVSQTSRGVGEEIEAFANKATGVSTQVFENSNKQILDASVQASGNTFSKTSDETASENISVDDVVKREIQEQLGESPDVPFARMRVIIIAVLILFILAFGVYFAFVM